MSYIFSNVVIPTIGYGIMYRVMILHLKIYEHVRGSLAQEVPADRAWRRSDVDSLTLKCKESISMFQKYDLVIVEQLYIASRLTLTYIYARTTLFFN